MTSTSSQARESWGSRLGFILAASGSAIGLANIWKFPYIVGTNGGGAFILTYLICTFLIGFPVMMCEVLMGRTTQSSPKSAFKKLGGKTWGFAGALTVFTALLVTSFYSAVAGWILGYLVEALRGTLHHFQGAAEAVTHYDSLVSHPLWGLGFHAIFLFICTFVVLRGVRGGLELGNKIMMPILFLILLLIALKGMALPGAKKGLHFIFQPDWSQLSPTAVLLALGQSFFTLSAGQGTMITYGSYMSKKDNLPLTCVPVIFADVIISVLACIAVFTIVFSSGLEPAAGPGLLFHTLPLVFSQIPGGYLIGICFFLLVTLAAISSEISAMEVVVAYLVDEWSLARKQAVSIAALLALLVGVPSALSYSLLEGFQPLSMPFVFFMDYLCTGLLIPLGGFLAVVLVGWTWGFDNAFQKLCQGGEEFFARWSFLRTYFRICICWVSPLLIVVVFMHAIGWI
ncbi:MAG: sodium-dependent transporter [Waddliaceae bacterium]|nr:sodium-dependent transporter [Waddliaceae bacterium]